MGEGKISIDDDDDDDDEDDDDDDDTPSVEVEVLKNSIMLKLRHKCEEKELLLSTPQSFD
jgi:hypothetical protein